jgi:hypothetical protein
MSYRRLTILLVLSLVTISAVTISANTIRSSAGKTGTECNDTNAQIMILGSYHMANPGMDQFNLQADDILSPKRQAEVTELIEKLVRYNPTKIAIEAPYNERYWTDKYHAYVAGKYQLGRNEIEQIGFNLAKRLNLPTLYPVDFSMTMNGLRPDEVEYPKPKPEDAGSQKAKTPAPEISPEDRLLRQSTVVDYLRHLNSAKHIESDHAQYLGMLLPSDNPAIYSKTDLVTNWYKRNLRIFTNINRITEPGKDRVLLIIGSGHLKLLKQFAADSNYFCLADTEEYLQ